MNTPIVSIAVTTYNQENFIAETLDGILMQKTNFNFEIVIGEDCGTDNTIDILKKYKIKYPDKIKLLDSIKNYGIELNLLRTIKKCIGKYIAICDGDDYWIDENKLQNQVDFLEKNQDYGTIATLRKDFIQEHNILKNIIKSFSESYKTISFENFLYKNFITPSTVLFRKKLMLDYIVLYDKHEEITFNDYNFFIFFSHKMKVAKSNERTIVYRVLFESGSRSKDVKKIWEFRKRFYNGLKLYLSIFNIKPKIKNDVLHYRAIEYYIIASASNDLEVCQEFLQIFKKNKDKIRYLLLKNSLKNKSINKLAHFLEKVNLRLGHKILKKVEII
jgi:glycosyltransferase involved in cell wall biosynthesis